MGRALAVVAALVLLAGCSGSTDGGEAAGTTAPASTDANSGAGADIGDDVRGGSNAGEGSGQSAPEVLEAGSLAVGHRSFVLVDDSRVTMAHGPNPELPERTLPVEVWYPAAGETEVPDGALVPEPVEDAEPADGRFPLVVLSHGNSAKGAYYVTAAAALVSAGYVVVAPDHPLSNADTPGGQTVVDMFQQAGDQSFLIDQFTDADGPVAEVVAHVDVDRVAVGGHSLGAITSLIAGTGEGFVDDRIDAVFAWSGFLATDVASDALTDARPVLLVHGVEDGTLSYEFAETAFEKLRGPRWLLSLPAEGHTPPFTGPRVEHPASVLVSDATRAFLDAELKDDPDGIDRLTALVDAVGDDEATLQHAP